MNVFLLFGLFTAATEFPERFRTQLNRPRLTQDRLKACWTGIECILRFGGLCESLIDTPHPKKLLGYVLINSP